MAQYHWMVRLVQLAAGIFVLLGCLMVFIYTPFYSQLVVKALNTFVPVEVNQVAAKSQEMAALSEYEELEPGSNLWIARQAYLKLMEQSMQNQNAQDLPTLQARYKALQKIIIEEQEKEENDKDDQPVIPLLVPSVDKKGQEQEQPVSDSVEDMRELLQLNSAENKVLMEQYIDFLMTHPVEQQEAVESEIYQDIAQIQKEKNEPVYPASSSKPYAIVVLGGGLTLADNQKDIVVNKYTRLRLEKTLEVEKQYHLPIVLSGVEAPYMQAWLKERNVEAKLLENRSMNTCENSRFSSLLLQKKGGAPTVILITDVYHMPRTRRLFALNGIETIPVEAPMPSKLTVWRPSRQNYDHSRRANYEMLATIRDILFGSSGCREVP
ncbi:YdcF family protein [Acinetobacter radioresistens]|uniref:YdcF family protein n=1 Tax=Acinetobacter radioresistens TaxID=40216 RepID=UPI00254A465C|nr:YdcF family protein [Acinetobacter radioresistens]MDK8754786.1 YdcF family protein [Acinetobacter radioresistens]